jgi:hypothetical protein
MFVLDINLDRQFLNSIKGRIGLLPFCVTRCAPGYSCTVNDPEDIYVFYV